MMKSTEWDLQFVPTMGSRLSERNNSVRLCVLGGSSVATVQLAQALSDWPGGPERRPALEIVLHGRDERKLSTVATQFSSETKTFAKVSSTHILEHALAGADIVLVQVRIGGLTARSFDESFPARAGLPGEETLGPGGLANAMRTVQSLESTWESMRSVCPSAFVIVLTNPAGIVRQSAAMHGMRAVEVCDSPVAFINATAKSLGKSSDEVARRYVGMNHLGWYVPINGAELDSLSSGQAVAPNVVRAHGAVPLGYVRYYVDQESILESQKDRPTRAEQLMELETEAMKKLTSSEMPDVNARPAPWYSLGVVPVIDAYVCGSDSSFVLGSANSGRLAALPDEVTVEGCVKFTSSGAMELLDLVTLPLIPSSILSRQATYEQLAIQAAHESNEERIFAAMLANPMVATARQAEVLTAALLEQRLSESIMVRRGTKT